MTILLDSLIPAGKTFSDLDIGVCFQVLLENDCFFSLVIEQTSALCAVNLISTINRNQISVVCYNSAEGVRRRKHFPSAASLQFAGFRQREAEGVIWGLFGRLVWSLRGSESTGCFCARNDLLGRLEGIWPKTGSCLTQTTRH